MQETVAVPEPATLVGVMVPHARPAGAKSLKLIVPANPFNEANVIVEVAEEPALTGAGEETDIVKFWNRNIAAAA